MATESENLHWIILIGEFELTEFSELFEKPVYGGWRAVQTLNFLLGSQNKRILNLSAVCFVSAVFLVRLHLHPESST